MFAGKIRKRRVAHMRGFIQWRWHLDEVFVKVNGKLCYLWRAVDHEGEVLETVVTAKRDKAAALKFLKRIVPCGASFPMRHAVVMRARPARRCQTNGRSPVCDIACADPSGYQAMSARHSPSAAKRLCL